MKASKKETSSKANKLKAPSKKSKTVAKVKIAPKAKAGSNKSLPSSPITKKPSKAEIYAELADLTGVAKADVKNLFEAMTNMIERTLKNKGAGELTLPIGVKLRRVNKPATKARPGRNPLTGEEIMIAAKPARKLVKATAMKALKELA